MMPEAIAIVCAPKYQTYVKPLLYQIRHHNNKIAFYPFIHDIEPVSFV